MKWIERYSFKNNPFKLGFLISLLGSLPLGYLNVIGLQILLEQGNLSVVSFILGIVAIEFFVLKIVSFAAHWLVGQKKLLMVIDIFTILFLGSIAWYFISNDKNFNLSQLQLAKHPFLLGVLLNSLNAIQWPYWSGIYIYLFRTNKLETTRKANYIFLVGALIGTFFGMLFFVYAGQYILVENNIKMTHYLNPIFSILFFTLATIQIAKLYLNRNKKVREIL
jgi:threonine/homoserine/homoserine lactone efflux protein